MNGAGAGTECFFFGATAGEAKTGEAKQKKNKLSYPPRMRPNNFSVLLEGTIVSAG